MSTAHAFTPAEPTAPRTELRLVEPEAAALLENARAESRLALRRLVELLGQPAEWGNELEEAAFARGVAWRLTATEPKAA